MGAPTSLMMRTPTEVGHNLDLQPQLYFVLHAQPPLGRGSVLADCVRGVISLIGEGILYF
jgi:hypothetical protein